MLKLFPIEAQIWCTDHYGAYKNVLLGKNHVEGKAHTFTVESKNAQVRHYLRMLSRKTKCYPKSWRTLNAAIAIVIKRINKGNNFKIY